MYTVEHRIGDRPWRTTNETCRSLDFAMDAAMGRFGQIVGITGGRVIDHRPEGRSVVIAYPLPRP